MNLGIRRDRHGNCVSRPDRLEQLPLGETHRSRRELRNVIAFYKGVVKRRVALRQEKGLAGISRRIDITEIEASEYAAAPF